MNVPNENEPKEELYQIKKDSGKMLHTYLRNQNRSYNNSFNMIDRKAAIMIRMNTTIISAVIILFRHIAMITYGRFIGISLVITSIFSLAFAMEASRPMVLDYLLGFRRNAKSRFSKLEQDIFAVGMTPDAELSEYEKAFDRLIKKKEFQIGAQVRTMYLFEKKIKKSFIMMELSYTLFIAGFITAAAAFVIGNF